MEKKRVFSKSLILLAITSIMLFAMSINIYGSDKCYKHQADRSRAE